MNADGSRQTRLTDNPPWEAAQAIDSRKLGYEVTGPPFVEAGIDHVPMSKRLG